MDAAQVHAAQVHAAQVQAMAGQAYQEGGRQAMAQAEQVLQHQVQAVEHAAQQQMAAMNEQHQEARQRCDDLWQERLRQQAAEDEERVRKLSEENARLLRRNSDLQAETATAKEEMATQLKSLLLEIRDPRTNTADVHKILWWLQQVTGGWVTTEMPGQAPAAAVQAPEPQRAPAQVAGRKRVHEDREPWVEQENRPPEVFGNKRNRAVEEQTRNTRQRLAHGAFGNVVLPLVPPTPS